MPLSASSKLPATSSLREATGTVAAVAFSFEGYLLSYPGLRVSILESATWLPLILLFVHRSMDARCHWPLNMSLAGAALALAILAGHPQTAMFLFYASLLYIVYLSCATRLPLARMLVACACFAFTAAAVSAVQLLPLLEFTPLSTRAKITYEAASRGYELISILGVILPEWNNEKALYVGVAPLVMAIFALARRSTHAWFWAGLACLSIVLSLGGKTPLFGVLFGAAPGFSLFRDQERIAILFSFSISVLAGLGVAAMFNGRRDSIHRLLTSH